MKLGLTKTFFVLTLFVNAQTYFFRINPNIVLPKDSIESKAFTTSLNDFFTFYSKAQRRK